MRPPTPDFAAPLWAAPGLTYLLANKLILKLVQTADSKCTNIPETNQFEFNLGEEREGRRESWGWEGDGEREEGGQRNGIAKSLRK